MTFTRGVLATSREPAGPDGHLWKRQVEAHRWVTDALNNCRLGMPISDATAEWEAITFPKDNRKPLRSYQEEAVAAWMKEQRGVIVMPTGTGKTEVAFEIMHQLSTHTLFVAPTRALAYQLSGRLADAFGVDVGFIGDNTFRLSPICVATYESAGIKMEFLGAYFKLLVFDECHHLPGDLRADAARMSAAPYRLGLTATPKRPDGRESLYAHLIGPVCYDLPLETVRGTVLANYRVRRVPVYLTDEEQAEYDRLGKLIRDHIVERRKNKPEYAWKDVTANLSKDSEARHVFNAKLRRTSIENNAAAKLDVLEDLFRQHTQQVVVFTGTNLMARMVSLRFLIPCLLSHSQKKERETILKGYEQGHFRAIIANRVLNEGIDIPAAKVGIIVGGTGSDRDSVQRLGRLLRKKGGQNAVLYEVVCAGTGEEGRSRKRRNNDAYKTRGSR